MNSPLATPLTTRTASARELKWLRFAQSHDVVAHVANCSTPANPVITIDIEWYHADTDQHGVSPILCFTWRAMRDALGY